MTTFHVLRLLLLVLVLAVLLYFARDWRSLPIGDGWPDRTNGENA